MSQVDLLIPQATLSACELRKSPGRDSYVDINAEPPSDELPNHDDKQAAVEEVEVAIVGSPIATTAEGKLESPAEEREVRPQIRKKRHRRGKKRKWRPYAKLTWDERKELQEREAKRAEKIRADMCACGMTLAPYNTTQFLMDDHNLQEPDYDHIPVGNHRHRMNSNDSSDDFYSSPEDEEDFLQQQFTETYKSIHAERLSNMSKGELVQELMSTEDKLENLQKRWESLQKTSESKTDSTTSNANPDLEEQMEKIRVFKEEISKLSQENERLRRENADFRRRLHL